MPRDAQAALLDPPIRALPGAREWRGVASERAALVDRILTHLCRRITEISCGGGNFVAQESQQGAALILAVHLVSHLGHGEPACEGCDTQLPIRLLLTMAQQAGRGAT